MAKRLLDSRRSAAGIALALTLPLPTAQQAFAQAGTAALEEIVVTARKREENLFEAPLSITSISSAEIENTHIRNVNELMNYTPGFYYTAQATFASNRVAPSMRFRGINNGSANPMVQQGGMFIDGVFLFGGAQSLTFEDVERVEVIKGPQSALFGRSTFSGAINVITKQPSDHFRANASAGYEERGTYDITGGVEGPIVQDRVFARLSGGRIVKGAHFHSNADGGALGYESTNSINAQLVFKPVDSLQIRLRRNDNWQDDSRSTVVNLNGADPRLLNAQHRCTTGTAPYWCGEFPLVGDPGTPFSSVSVATSLNPSAFRTANFPNALIQLLNNDKSLPLVRNGMPYYSSVPKLTHAGLAGRFQRTSIEVTYDLPNDWSFNTSYVYSRMATMSFSSSSDDAGNGWIMSPNVMTDYSLDTRLSSDPNQRLNGSIGANYFLQTSVGGTAGTGGVISVPDVTRVVAYNEPTTFTGQGRLLYYGVFGTLHYDIVDQLALDLEGRYASERETTSYQLSTQTSTIFKAFVPRVILTYKPTSELTAYASWARGSLPGTTNSSFPLLFPALQAQILAIPNFKTSVPPESVQNFELGVKQQSSTFRYALTGYYMKWSNLKNSVSFPCPNSLCGPGLPASFAGATIPQSAKIYGVEAEVGVVLNEHWDANVSFDVVRARYDSYFQPLTLAPTGKQDGSGKTIIGFPTSQAVLSTTYRDEINANWGWYVRGDVNYIGKIYVDEINQAWIGAAVKLNAHVGVERANGQLRFELYGDNLTNDKHWLGGLRATQNNYHLAAVVVSQPTASMVLPRLRAFGVRVTAKFD